MKKSISVILVLVLFGWGLSAQAQQKFKFGHINSQELLQAMPENDSAQAHLQRFAKELQDQYDAMQVEYNKKAQEFQDQQNNLTDLIKKTKLEELQHIQQTMQEFQTNAQQEMQKKQAEVLQPIIDKANQAIKEVAQENGFTYIFDISRGTILYFSDQSIDILPLVKKKLGIQ
ncbi:MAG TPA: OmpH family outer membrane protein [Bacteroidetes bacterium]|nr:OmpH family outer membrane protein [Bacteroidota bacterium]